MRTEVKIGIFIALIVAGVVVVYLVDQAKQGGNLSQTVPLDRTEFDDEVPTGDPTIAPDERPTDNGQPAQRRPDARQPRGRNTTPPPTTDQPARPRIGFQPRGDRAPVFDNAEPEVVPTEPNEALDLTPSDDERPTRLPLTTQPAPPPDEPNVAPVRTPDEDDAPPADRDREPEQRAPPQPPDQARGRVLPPTRDTADEPTRREPERRLPPREGPRRHKIVEGDSLWSLAEDYYGDGALWKQIAAANPGMDPDRIKVGQTLVIPPKAGTDPPAPGIAAPTTAEPGSIEVRKHEYVVERGDTLSSIARHVLQDVGKWRLIYELNQDRIDDPDVLTPGLVLRLPKD